MSPIASHRAPHTLRPRSTMGGAELQLLWRVETGVLRIDGARPEHAMEFVRLALPGDVLGLELRAGSNETMQARALTHSILTPIHVAREGQVSALLLEFAVKAHQRGREMMALRSGSTDERVKRLLHLLSDDPAGINEGEPLACALPTLSEMAAIVHSTPETVCRVLTQLRRESYLLDYSPSSDKHKRLQSRDHRLRASLH